MDLKRIGEFGLIDRLTKRNGFPNSKLDIGIGDDCAVFKPSPGKRQVVTTDALIEHIHFNLSTITPYQLGWKSLAVNLSDIAAMGGVPRFAFLSLGIPTHCDVTFLDSFSKGFHDLAGKYEVELAGGDTTRSLNDLFINVTLIGEVSSKKFFCRKGAQEDDALFVSGDLGDSALGLELLQTPGKSWIASKTARAQLIRKHTQPEPRVNLARELVSCNVKITSMIDISDGLAQDLGHICKANSLGAQLWEQELPSSPALRKVCRSNNLNPMSYILGGGEDYELLFTSPSKDAKKVLRHFQKAEVSVSQIGVMLASPKKLTLVGENDREVNINSIKGFDHFK